MAGCESQAGLTIQLKDLVMQLVAACDAAAMGTKSCHLVLIAVFLFSNHPSNRENAAACVLRPVHFISGVKRAKETAVSSAAVGVVRARSCDQTPLCGSKVRN